MKATARGQYERTGVGSIGHCNTEFVLTAKKTIAQFVRKQNYTNATSIQKYLLLCADWLQHRSSLQKINMLISLSSARIMPNDVELNANRARLAVVVNAFEQRREGSDR